MLKLTAEEQGPPLLSHADGWRFVDVSSFRGRPLARTLRGGSTAGGRGGISAGSGNSGSMLVRSIIPNWAGGKEGISAGSGSSGSMLVRSIKLGWDIMKNLELAELALVGHIARKHRNERLKPSD